MENLRPPREMSLEGDVATNFKRWKQQFTIFMEASGTSSSTTVTAERKATILLHTVGPEVQDIYNTLEIPEADRKDWEKLLDHLGNHFKPTENETINRHLFHTRKQKEGESIDMFVTDLKKLSRTCNFGNLKDSLIRDRIVCGIIDSKVRDRLLREANLSLTKCINICRASEIAEIQSKQLVEEASAIHAVRNKNRKYKKQVVRKK